MGGNFTYDYIVYYFFDQALALKCYFPAILYCPHEVNNIWPIFEKHFTSK